MAINSSIFETFTLPSKGLIYNTPINPQVSLRSMTTIEEMKRLSHSDTPYKVMADIIEDCLAEKPAIHVYDMCIGDYQFLLHKLRIVTYGTDYKLTSICPKCGQVVELETDLDSLEIITYDDSIIEKQQIVLPVTNDKITLKYQTPRDIDDINYKTKEFQKKTKQNIDYSLLFTVVALIKQINGRELSSVATEEYVKKLPMKDINFLLAAANELNQSIGLKATIDSRCGVCGESISVPFRITSEFFGPTTSTRW